MRIRHSLKALIPVILMLAGAQTVQAQGGPPMQGMPGPGMPGPGMPGLGMPMAGQQIPGTYGMYPYQSPYQGMFEQTYQRDGTWFQNSVNGFGPTNRPRDWFMNLDYTRTTTRKMAGIVGAQGVPTYLQQNDPGNNDMNQMSFFRYFDAASASIIPDLKASGIRLSGGFWNPDGSGFLYSGGYQFEDTATFDARQHVLASQVLTGAALLQFERNSHGGNLPYNLGGRTDRDIVENEILAPGVTFDSGNLVPHDFFGTTSQILDRTLLNLYGIPTTIGQGTGTVNGETAPYDLDFILKHKVNTGGVNAAWAFSPVYEKDNFKIRPIVGGRYFRIDETFRFDGASTLLSYITRGDSDTPINAKTFLPDTGILNITTGTGGTGTTTGGTTTGGTGTTGATSSAGYTAPIAGIIPTHLIVRSYINSQVVSNLSGPELGFQYELGRTKGIQVTGSTRVAAMFNNEKLRLNGDNIGNFMGHQLLPGTADPTVILRMFDTNTTQGPSQNAFSDTASNTHLSPLFEQSLNAQIPIFGRVPVLRDMWQLEDAKLSLGWTFLLIGQVAEPNSSIVYNSNPLLGDYLHYKIDRDTFTQNTFNVGINWNY